MIRKIQFENWQKRIIAAMLLLFLSFQVHADDKPIVIGTFAQMPPFSFRGEGVTEGFDVDLIQAIARSQGWQVKVIEYPLNHLTEGLDKEIIDLMVSSLFETPERKQHFEVSLPYAHAEDTILYLDPNIKVQEDHDLTGLKIAALENSVQSKNLVNVIGVPAENIIPVKSTYLGYKALVQKQADAMLAYSQALHYLTLKKPGNFQFYTIKQIPPRRLIALGKKGNRTLIEQFNQGLETIKKDGSYQKIYNKWFNFN